MAEALKNLPQELGQVAAAVPSAHDRLLDASLVRLRPTSPQREVFRLGDVRFSWRLYLQRKDEDTLFFFLRRDVTDPVYFKARVDVAFAPRPQADGPLSRLPHTNVFRLSGPRFLLIPGTNLRKRLLQAWKTWQDDRPMPTQRAVVGLRTGEVMVLCNHKHKKGPSEIYGVRARGNKPLWRLGRGNPWPIRPFMSLLETLRAWVTAETRDPFGRKPFKKTPAWQVLLTMVDSYRSAHESLAKADRPSRGPLATLAETYEMDAFAAQLDLWLTPSGKLADSNSGDHLTQLRFDLDLTPEEGRLRADVNVSVPDFLTEGELYEDLLDSLVDVSADDEDDTNLRMVAEALRFKKDDARAEAYVKDARKRATVIRIERTAEDETDLFVLPGRVSLALLSVTYEREGDPPGVMKNVKRTFFGSPAGTGKVENDDAVRHLLGLVAQLDRWKPDASGPS